MLCPKCGNQWPPWKPFKELHCEVCTAEKKRRMDAMAKQKGKGLEVGELAARLNRLESPEQFMARAAKDQELWK